MNSYCNLLCQNVVLLSFTKIVVFNDFIYFDTVTYNDTCTCRCILLKTVTDTANIKIGICDAIPRLRRGRLCLCV